MYQVPFETEIYDVGGCFNPTTYSFYPPIDGVYHFNIVINISGILSTHTTATIGFVRNTIEPDSYTFYINMITLDGAKSSAITMNASWDHSLLSTDVCSIVFYAAGSTKVIDFVYYSYWSGFIVN